MFSLDIFDSIPAPGYLKGMIHLVAGNIESSIQSFDAATRTVIVCQAGIYIVANIAPGAPFLAAAAGGVGGGLAYDLIISGIASIWNKKYSPHGYLKALQKSRNNFWHGLLDLISTFIQDGASGVWAVRSRVKTTVYRVEGQFYRLNKKKNIEITSCSSTRLSRTDNGGVAVSNCPLSNSRDAARGNTHLHLNFGCQGRAEQYYAKRSLQHQKKVKMLKAMGMNPKPFSQKIKAFKIPASCTKLIKERAVPEFNAKINPKNQGIIQVDANVAPNQFSLNGPRASELSEKVILHTYEEYTPWLFSMPSPLLRLINNHPIVYRHIRQVVNSTSDTFPLVALLLAIDFISNEWFWNWLHGVLHSVSKGIKKVKNVFTSSVKQIWSWVSTWGCM